jgi:hypothetical protein
MLRAGRRARTWHAGGVTDPDRTAPAGDWLTVPELVEILGIPQGRVRRLFEERVLVALRVDGVLRVPAAFLLDGEPLGELRGTLILLADAGFSDEEAVHWLLEDTEALDVPPIEALRAGRKAEVRRVAQALGF